MLIFQFVHGIKFPKTVFIWKTSAEDKGEAENKNAFTSAKRGMKAFNESRRKQIGGLAPSFSLRRSCGDVDG
jgi:hypothetical protein